MRIVTATAFCKRVACPSSEALLNYQTSGFTTAENAWIARHVIACDFCGAELQLLAEHPPLEERCPETSIPANLRQLAESLLYGNHPTTSIRAACAKESLTLTDA
jgi:hypothetical protein